MIMPILEMDKIRKAYSGGFLGRKRPVLNDLSLQIEPGEVFGLLGHNGAGKTTAMRVILGLLRPDAGKIRLFGEDGAGRSARARIGYLGDEIGLYPQFNAEEMLQYAGELFRIRRSILGERKKRLLHMVGLAPHAGVRIKGYSKGMRQRLGVALALLNDPEFLMLDEPYSGLDPIGRRQLRKLLLDLKRDGKTILLSSHIVPDVEAVCDRVGILRGGQIRKCLALRDIYAQKSTPVEITVSGVQMAALERDHDVELIYTNPQATVLKCGGREHVKNVIMRIYQLGGTVLEVKPLKFNLEDYLLEELGGGESLPGADTLPLESEDKIYASR